MTCTQTIGGNINHRGSRRLAMVFARLPIMGTVKTRLADRIGPEAALAFYEACVADILETVARAGLPLQVCITPAEKLKAAAAWLGPDIRLAPQRGAELGERMAGAFEQAFSAGYSRAVLMGTDMPDLPPRMLTEAVAALDHTGASLIPTRDGGYCLIGFRSDRFLPAVFVSMPWGTGTVAARTLAVFRGHGRTVKVLPTWRDIDNARDLAAFIRDRTPGAGPARHARRCLADLEESIPPDLVANAGPVRRD
jgi:rSAM/selenodomain-associated transferase 1